MQSKKRSLQEAISNVVVGLLLAAVANYSFLQHQGYVVTWQDMSVLAVIMTILSLVRSYLIRRFFNVLED